jgi:hypothetical protein
LDTNSEATHFSLFSGYNIKQGKAPGSVTNSRSFPIHGCILGFVSWSSNAGSAPPRGFWFIIEDLNEGMHFAVALICLISISVTVSLIFKLLSTCKGKLTEGKCLNTSQIKVRKKFLSMHKDEGKPKAATAAATVESAL